MSRPKFFRDPLHLQIRFEPVDICDDASSLTNLQKESWVLRKLIDSEPFQRLRHVRQNGLTNLVFHGAEHSRFSHSMGVSHLARVMFECLCRNSSVEEAPGKKIAVSIASLIHDVGHGPLSHAMEEILRENDIPFHHEDMTLRFINDPDSEIFSIIKSLDSNLNSEISRFFDKKLRSEDRWEYKIVSSQMDADRLDYVQRDSLFAGIKGHGFDIDRLFDLIYISNDENISVDRGAIEAVEAYLVTLDQLWRAVYYHHAVRSATKMLAALFRRAYVLYRNSDTEIFPPIAGKTHPLQRLFDEGREIPLPEYLRLTDALAWALIDGWRLHKDPTLSDLANRLLRRDLFKSVPLNPEDLRGSHDLFARASEIVSEMYPDVEKVDETYLLWDSPDRISYKVYDWKPEQPSESIWLTGGGKGEMPIEADTESTIVRALQDRRKFDRLIMPEEVRKKLTQ